MMQPPLLTSLCYIREGGKTLMLHRIKKENDVSWGKWHGLGGKFLPGESPEECVKREVREESGLDIRKPRLRGFLTYPNFMHGRDEYVYLYTATEFEGGLIDSDEGKLAWVDDHKLLDLNLWEGDKLFFEWLKKDAFFSAKLVYEAERLIRHEVVFYT